MKKDLIPCNLCKKETDPKRIGIHGNCFVCLCFRHIKSLNFSSNELSMLYGNLYVHIQSVIKNEEGNE